ncbi:MAG TPA: hypothetical protein DD381_07005 [Lentisphaeria bacterium]|nr:MAG: hypothetical protein A2X47_10900 [Lentisphaerae bacterium GWF2_38_69]HBM16072.1 hypothetical protein [Lentisphaeria bacterium]
MLPTAANKISLRPYQLECLTAIETTLQNHSRTACVMSTGSGKTIVFSEFCRQKKDPVLIVVNQTELIKQTIEKMSFFGLSPEVISGAVKRDSDSHVTVCSIQTLSRDEILLTMPVDKYRHIIIDECHHCTAETFQSILKHFRNYKLIGFTATLERTSKHEGFAEIFDSICYEYSIDKGIAEGFLCPIKTEIVELPKVIKANATTKELAETNLYPIADHLQNFADRRALVFMPTIALSMKFAEVLQDANINARHVDGNSPDREEIISDFKANKFNFLLSKNLLLEGFDVPDVNLLVLLRPTDSRIIYAQSVGRGLRIAPGKTECLVLDYMGLTMQHELYKQPLLESPVEKETREAVEREKAVRDDYNRFLNSLLTERNPEGKALYDPYQLKELFPQLEEFSKPKSALQYPTDKQVKALVGFRVKPCWSISKISASYLLDILFKRIKEELCTVAQAMALKRIGIKEPFNIKFTQVDSIIKQRTYRRHF